MTIEINALKRDIAQCQLCQTRFAATQTKHMPRPVVWFEPSARILIAGQAPGARVHESGKPFTDPSGDRLRAWLGMDQEAFYDLSKVAIVPMAFCFPGYDARKADLPPPKICAQTWREDVMRALPNIGLKIIIGGYAQSYHLGRERPVTESVAAWRDYGSNLFVLPHPSWRNTGWLKRNPWFEVEIVPALQARVKEVMT
ncbi:MAG: uracil-DNA glycosylase family protein [Pseudomonadota bacterium]